MRENATRASTLFFNFVDSALHVKVTFRNFVMFAFEDFFEAADGFRDWHLLAFATFENLRDSERLTEELLHFARGQDSNFVVGRKFVHSENGDDVLKIFRALENFLHAPRDIVMF